MTRFSAPTGDHAQTRKTADHRWSAGVPRSGTPQVRDQDRADALADRLGQAPALLLRGNGAVTVGASIGEAVARMWVLEASARMNLVAAAAGTPAALPDHEQAAW